MNQITLNGSKLKSISNASHTAEVTITALALRERLRHFSDITRTRNLLVRSGEKIVDTDYMNFWKGLQDAGVGVIVYGRKGKADRFEWHYSMKKVAQAALEGKDQLADKIPSVKAKPTKRPEQKIARKLHMVKPTIAAPVKKEKLLYIPLRKDFNLEISVPSDLSKAEAEMIGSALRRLSA